MKHYHYMRYLRSWVSAGVILLALEILAGPHPVPAPRPARVILAIVDGLHCDAPQRLAMTNLLHANQRVLEQMRQALRQSLDKKNDATR